MNMNRRIFQKSALVAGLVSSTDSRAHSRESPWSVATREGRLVIQGYGRNVAEYVYGGAHRNPATRRPYFQNVCTRGGDRITRLNPPDPAAEDTDHVDMHPGIWLSFGSLNGIDYWRNKAEVRHVRFVEGPAIDNETLSFAVENQYMDLTGAEVVCREIARHVFRYIRREIVWDWSSELSTERPELVIGHQEEMGLGVRLTRRLTVNKGKGRIDSSTGGVNEKGTWGDSATWWAASVPSGSSSSPPNTSRTGIQILATWKPGDRPFWGHTRDYGLIVANPSIAPKAGTNSFNVPNTVRPQLKFRIRLFDAADTDFAGWAEKYPVPT